MMTNIEIFTKKTARALDRNLEIQEIINELAMKIDTAHDYQSKLLRYVKNCDILTKEDMEQFCLNNQESIDILLNDQEVILNDIRGITKGTAGEYVIDSFIGQNRLAHLNNIYQIDQNSKSTFKSNRAGN